MVEWRDIPGWEGYYAVSEDGQVCSLPRTIYYKDGRVGNFRGRALKPRPDRHGYLSVALHRDDVAKNSRVHRLVLEAFVGPCPMGSEALHQDGNVANNHVSNLRWDTHTENVRDTVRHGTHGMLRRTECPLGHPLVAPNLVRAVALAGARGCLACSRGRGRVVRNPERDLKGEADAAYAEIMGLAAPKPDRYCTRGHLIAAPNLRRTRNSHQCAACYRAHMSRYRNPSLDVQEEADRHYALIIGSGVAARHDAAQGPSRAPAQRGPLPDTHPVRDGAAPVGRAM